MPAFFRMELHAQDVALSDDAGDRKAIVGGSQDAFFAILCIEAVNVINMAAGAKFPENRILLPVRTDI